MTIEELKEKNCIVFECISGSHAHGLATTRSDVDIRGVFILPKSDYFGLDYVEQVNNATNDVVYFELRKFMELLAKSNPNALELLYTPEDCILSMHPVFERIRQENVLSRACKSSFGNYAFTQIRKARGLIKKIMNPIDKRRKRVLEFCYVPDGQHAIALDKYLEMNDLSGDKCGLSDIPHMPDVYGLYYGEFNFQGITRKDTANDVVLSSVPKGMEPLTLMYFNRDAYSTYCKAYKEYWDWVTTRNEVRYEETTGHGRNYDAKNMMHTFRLLHMCEEIGREGRLHVRRLDRAYLLKIREGAYTYEDLMQKADQKMTEIEVIYANTALAEFPDRNRLNALLVVVREQYYLTESDERII